MNRGLRIASDLLETMLQAARDAAPEECCGLLVGTLEPAPRVLRLVPAANTHAEPRRFFEIDPKVHFDTLRALRQSGEALLGHYHSHPAGPARPSPRDLAAVTDDQLAWLVIDPLAGEVAGFLPRRGEDGDFAGFDAIPLLV
jgi:proteasome lid subunit RPN8/RPN11